MTGLFEGALDLAALAREELDPELERYVVYVPKLGKFVKHPLCFDMLTVPGVTNLNYRTSKAMADDAYQRHSWSLYIVAHARPYRLTRLADLFDSGLIDRDELRPLLEQFWRDTEFPRQFGAIPRRLFRAAGFLTDAPELWKTMPDELIVYRGASRKPGPNAISWSLARGVGEFFARRFSTKRKPGQLWRADVHKRDVLAYFEGRGEAEIVVSPSVITNLSTLTLGDAL